MFFYKRHLQHGKSLPHSALALHALSGSGFAKKAGGDRSLGFREARFEKRENEKLHFEAGSFVLELLSFWAFGLPKGASGSSNMELPEAPKWSFQKLQNEAPSSSILKLLCFQKPWSWNMSMAWVCSSSCWAHIFFLKLHTVSKLFGLLFSLFRAAYSRLYKLIACSRLLEPLQGRCHSLLQAPKLCVIAPPQEHLFTIISWACWFATSS